MLAKNIFTGRKFFAKLLNLRSGRILGSLKIIVSDVGRSVSLSETKQSLVES